MIPTQVFTSTRINSRGFWMNNTWVLIWQQELPQASQRFHRSSFLRRVAFGSNENQDPAPRLRNDAANEIRSLQ